MRVTALSTRAEYATNGDLLVAVEAADEAALAEVRVDLDGRDVTSVFSLDDSPFRAPGTPPRLVGLVAGLVDGENRVTASVDGDTATLDVVNHPVDGPLFSGPQQSPFVCTTQRNGLGPAEGDCWARTQVRWVYRTTDGRTVDLADPTVTPADAAVVTRNGRSVPFVIRIEKGVFNRSVTTFATLDPQPGPVAGTVPGPTPARVWDDSAWNGRLVMRFGGGCGASFSQGDGGGGAVDPELLADGYAVITSTLTTFQTACNDVVAAETVMVAKEHFSEAYGLPRFTIGAGGSGGAIQQLLVAQNYPGLLDAVAPVIPFPDALSIAGGVADCGLLSRWFADPAGGATFTDAQRLAVLGFASPVTCLVWQATYLPNIDPSVGCDEALVRAGQVYDPVSNPRGARCTLQDSNVNLLGTDAETGFALSPLDNVGVQYGLGALGDGVIGVDEFLALNEGIGGYDVDGVWQPERTRASDEVLERAYREGRVTAGTASADAGALSPAGAGGSDRRARAARQRLQRPDRRHPRPPAGLRHPRPAPAARRVGQSERGAVDRTRGGGRRVAHRPGVGGHRRDRRGDPPARPVAHRRRRAGRVGRGALRRSRSARARGARPGGSRLGPSGWRRPGRLTPSTAACCPTPRCSPALTPTSRRPVRCGLPDPRRPAPGGGRADHRGPPWRAPSCPSTRAARTTRCR